MDCNMYGYSALEAPRLEKWSVMARLRWRNTLKASVLPCAGDKLTHREPHRFSNAVEL